MAEMGNLSNEDRISNLPDSLIHLILSFSDIDMKDVVQTCVLSKRWIHVWKSLPTLNFSSEVHWRATRGIGRTGNALIPFVDKVLSLRDRSCIHRFQLRCRHMDIQHFNSDHVYRWIASVVSLNVEELCIDIERIIGDFEIPSCLATCESLLKLELVLNVYGYCEGKKKIILPVSISLPRLKSLCLSLASLAFDDENVVTNFFSGCPALESLQLYCEFPDMNLIVSLPLLKHFVYSENENNDNIQLCAPNLSHLKLIGCISSDYTLENLASLTSADIFTCVKRTEDTISKKAWKIRTEKKGLYANKVMKLLKGLYNVKDLRLTEYILKALSGAPDMLGSQPHQLYDNLRTLKLRTWLTRGCLHSIIYLLRNSPRIESLSLLLLDKSPYDVRCRKGGCLDFDEVTYDSGIVGNNREEWLLLPCMIDDLKFIEVRGIQGCLNELKLLEFLLKNAIAVEKLILIAYRGSSKPEVLKKFHEKLLTYPRASEDADILLESK